MFGREAWYPTEIPEKYQVCENYIIKTEFCFSQMFSVFYVLFELWWQIDIVDFEELKLFCSWTAVWRKL